MTAVTLSTVPAVMTYWRDPPYSNPIHAWWWLFLMAPRVLSPSYLLYHLYILPLATIFVWFEGLSITPSDDTTSLLKIGCCHFLRIVVMNVQFCQDECQSLSIYIFSPLIKSQWAEYILYSVLITSVCIWHTLFVNFSVCFAGDHFCFLLCPWCSHGEVILKWINAVFSFLCVNHSDILSGER